MKTIILFLAYITFSITFVSCESHEQKADEAFISFRDNKNKTIDSVIVYRDTSITDISKTNKIPEKIEERVKFKNDIQEKVKQNGIIIRKIKAYHDLNPKSFRKITNLEFTNTQLLKKIADYQEEAKKNWELFEDKLIKETKDLDLELKKYKQ